MTQAEQQNVNMIRGTYDSVPIKTLLKGYRKRIIEILNKNAAVGDVLKNKLRNDKIIIECGSRSTAIENIDSLREMWGTLLDLTGYVCGQLNSDDELDTINKNETTKNMCADIMALVVNIRKYLDENDIPKEPEMSLEGDIEIREADFLKYVKGLDALFPYKNDTGNMNAPNWKKIITYGIFKQIYTQVYSTICDYNKYARSGSGSNKTKISKKINTKVDKQRAINSISYRSSKDFNETLSEAKAKNIVSWINSRWDWRIPICCIDKMIIAVDSLAGDGEVSISSIPPSIYDYLPTVVYFSRKCKSSPTAYISNIEFIKCVVTEAGEVMFIRCGKAIKEGTNGYYIDLTASLRKINFDNLNKYNAMTSEIWNHVIISSSVCYTPSSFVETEGALTANNQTFIKK